MTRVTTFVLALVLAGCEVGPPLPPETFAPVDSGSSPDVDQVGDVQPEEGAGDVGPGPDSTAPPDSGDQVEPDAGDGDTAPPTPPPGFVLVPAGTFVMGSPGPECPGPDCIDPRCSTPAGCPGPEPGRRDDEHQRVVEIPRAFFMATTEVTQEEWEAVMGANPSTFRDCGSSCPVESVSWYEAIAFANRRSEVEGLGRCYVRDDGLWYGEADAGRRVETLPGCDGYRLPTEEEWEYAARAGTATAYWSGEAVEPTDCDRVDPALDLAGWYCANASGRMHRTGEKAPNPWGLLDVHGNVWEWTAAPGVYRGGDVGTRARYCRAGSRAETDPFRRIPTVGLRLVLPGQRNATL